jgi:DNA-binding NtrC family response regulator
VVAWLRERAGDRGLPPGSPGEGLREVVHLAELTYVDELLRMTEGNVSRAAEMAGITRPNMHRKILDLGLDANSYRRAL